MATKILVLDTTEGIADMLNFSRTADYDVYSASTATDATQVIEDQRPQLLICDINVPDTGGIEFLCHIKKCYPGIEVIMIADDHNSNTAFQCLKYEASDFIIKPVTNDSLEIVIERAKRKLAIRKKLSPSQGDSELKEEIAIQRLSITEQILSNLSASQLNNRSSISNIISIHNANGKIVHASPEYIDLIGEINSLKSWDMYTGEASSEEMCPSSFAFNTKISHLQKAVLKTKENKEIEVEVFAAPLVDSDKKADLVIEIINL